MSAVRFTASAPGVSSHQSARGARARAARLDISPPPNRASKRRSSTQSAGASCAKVDPADEFPTEIASGPIRTIERSSLEAMKRDVVFASALPRARSATLRLSGDQPNNSSGNRASGGIADHRIDAPGVMSTKPSRFSTAHVPML